MRAWSEWGHSNAGSAAYLPRRPLPTSLPSWNSDAHLPQTQHTQLLVLTSGTGVMPPEFASSALSTYSAWAVALVIICINSGTAVETFITVLPPGVLAAAGFALFAATYLAFILFLAVGPKRSARLLRIVGWGARDPRPAGGAGVGGKEPVPDSAVPLLAYQPERQ